MATTSPSNSKNDPAANVQTMRTYVHTIQQDGDLSHVDQFVHRDFVAHLHANAAVRGPDWTRAMVRNIHSAFSDIRIEIVHCVAEGDMVATHKVLRGKHTGDLYGKAPTGREVEIRFMDFVRFEDGKLREHWANVSGAP